ncbi:dual specificity protein phosphatase [Chthoniobacter flavus Ellin428]|uniref:Dual specificity protein phosphatase n=1 Tax=Chthoniobacter flavus Ellin428 TaxID=497964 RepID=B4D479_9BACT|nr:dual specificity protein phosphatase family protein [Chthoniobacter flavus]EDY18680.1 dual specificity protein phosphatase [Chthoniobacter flavus Ellin428]TCO89081.1 dual specificity protein phosphatase-like protein [Chthoniobacter flavus]
MAYAVVLLALAAALITLGITWAGVGGVLLIWLAANFLLLGIAHVRRAHRLFGKRSDGTLPWWSWVAFLPMHLSNLAVWHLYRLANSEPVINEICHEVSIGRRLLSHELSRGFANYVDLTAEFAEPRALRKAQGYYSFPILDGTAPSLQRLKEALSSLAPGKTFVHCAQGHGRSGLFAVAYLLSTGRITSIEAGLKLLAETRPAVRLNEAQMECLRSYTQLGGVGSARQK